MIASELVQNSMRLLSLACLDNGDEDDLYRKAIDYLRDDEITETTDKNGRYCLWMSELYTPSSKVNYLYYPDDNEFVECYDENIDEYLY